MEAASSGNIEIVRVLLKSFNNDLPKHILYYSCVSGNYELVKYILDINKDNDFLIDVNVVDVLSLFLGFVLVFSFFHSFLGRTALHEAVDRCFIEIVKLLLERKDLNIDGGVYVLLYKFSVYLFCLTTTYACR